MAERFLPFRDSEQRLRVASGVLCCVHGHPIFSFRRGGLDRSVQQPEWKDKWEGGAKRGGWKETFKLENLVRKFCRFPGDRQESSTNP